MSPLLFAAVSVSGGIGATLRFVLDGVIRSLTHSAAPWGTISINISGSFLLGILTSLAAGSILPEQWLAIFGAGFLGGYTTFSTASLETVRLIRARLWGPATSSGLGTLLGSVTAAGFGLWLGSLA